LRNRDQLRESLQKDSKPQKRGVWHNKAYHRYFEGYTEISVPSPNGKGTVIQRIYTGDYYRQDLAKPQRILLRALYLVLYLCAVYLFVSSAVLPLPSNSTWYVTISQAVSIPFLFWLAIVLVSYLPAGYDMTINEYRSSSLALKKSTIGAAISLGTAALVTLVFIFLNQADRQLVELPSMVKYLVGGLSVFLMNRIENKVNYLIIPSQNKPPIENVDIQ
jgi:hypothetical protein